jgi:hypothetical protein
MKGRTLAKRFLSTKATIAGTSSALEQDTHPLVQQGAQDFSFWHPRKQTFYIFVTGYAGDPDGDTGTLNMRVDAHSEFFGLDRLFHSNDYSSSFKLSVQAGFGPSVAVESVRMTFHRP